ncbi:hypothetical protein ROU88_08115 [Macrococcus capreoli]
MNKKSSWIWLGNQLNNYIVTAEPSLWKELIVNRNVTIGEKTNKRTVYISGEPNDVYKMLDLFIEVPSENKLTILTQRDFDHPALKWMEIYYYPPALIKEVPGNSGISIFVNNRIPIWARKLIVNSKAKRIISVEEVNPVKTGSTNTTCYITMDQFNYNYLLNDSLVINCEHMAHQKFADIPNQLKIKYIKSNSQEALNILDMIASNMLNEYWLINKPYMHQWISVLLREIDLYLKIKNSDISKEDKLIAVEKWGYHDKSIIGS